MFLLCCALLFFVAASTNWANGWDPKTVKFARGITRPFNNARKNIDLYTVSYNYYFADEILKTRPASWFSQPSNKSEPFPLVGNINNTISMNAYFFMDLPELKYWKRYGMKYAFSLRKRSSLKKLIDRAEACYDPWDCSRDPPLNNFISCYSSEKICAGSNVIYSYVYLKSFSMLSCVESGPLVICFGRFNMPRSAYSFDLDDDYF